jgi:hypothetical protein
MYIIDHRGSPGQKGLEDVSDLMCVRLAQPRPDGFGAILVSVVDVDRCRRMPALDSRGRMRLPVLSAPDPEIRHSVIIQPDDHVEMTSVRPATPTNGSTSQVRYGRSRVLSDVLGRIRTAAGVNTAI